MMTVSMMADVLKDVGVTSYKINETVTASYEMFFVGRRVETVRRTDTTEINVTVYVDHDGATGASSFAAYPSADMEELRAAAERAKERALLVFDPPYGLPEAQTGTYDVPSAMQAEDAPTLGARLAEAVLSAECPKGAAINALEVFIKDVKVRVLNSRGTDTRESRRVAQLELIPTYNGEDGSVELYEFYSLAEADIEALRAKVSARMFDAEARMKAKAPSEPLGECAVVFSSGELRTLFDELAYDLTYASAYQHANRFSVGDRLQSEDAQADRLTVTACAEVEGSPKSSRYDGDGVALCDRTLIKDGVAVGRFGSHRFASYLGEQTTGALPCLRVEGGVKRAEQLREGRYLECVYMSGLQVDLFNDYIGGEVRLAYLCDGEVRVPVTGISVSARLSDVLSRMHLSSECETVGGYRGPALGRFDGFTVF